MNQEAITIFILGARGAGKTSFLTGLSILSQPNQKSHFQLLPKDNRTAQLITDIRNQVQLGEWPPGTITTTPLSLELTYEKTKFQLSMLEYAGEDLLSAMETMDLQERENIKQNLIAADCMLLLLDPAQDLDTRLNDSDKSMTDRRQTALATAIGYSIEERNRLDDGNQVKKPRIYPILTKSDLFEQSEWDEITQNNENLLKRLREYAQDSKQIQVNPISACGRTSDKGVSFPENPEPDGYDKLFKRIAKDCRKKRTENLRKILLISLVIVALITVTGLVLHNQAVEREAEIIKNGTCEEISDISDPDVSLLDQRVEKEIKTFQSTLNNPNSTLKQLQDARDKLMCFRELRHHEYDSKLDEMLDQFNSIVGDRIFSNAKAAYDSGNKEKARDACVQYLETFPNGIHRQKVDKILEEIIDTEHKKYLNPIRAVKATSESRVRSKIEKIEEYRNRFPDMNGRDADVVDRAIKTARMLIHSDQVTLVFSSMKFDTEKRDVSLLFYKNPPGRRIKDGKYLYKSEEEVNVATFDKKVRLKKSDWSDLEVCLWDLEWGNEIMATRRINLYRDLFRLNGEGVDLRSEKNFSPKTKGSFKAQVQINSGRKPENLSKAQLQAYENFIHPGNKW